MFASSIGKSRVYFEAFFVCFRSRFVLMRIVTVVHFGPTLTLVIFPPLAFGFILDMRSSYVDIRKIATSLAACPHRLTFCSARLFVPGQLWAARNKNRKEDRAHPDSIPPRLVRPRQFRQWIWTLPGGQRRHLYSEQHQAGAANIPAASAAPHRSDRPSPSIASWPSHEATSASSVVTMRRLLFRCLEVPGRPLGSPTVCSVAHQ